VSRRTGQLNRFSLNAGAAAHYIRLAELPLVRTLKSWPRRTSLIRRDARCWKVVNRLTDGAVGDAVNSITMIVTITSKGAIASLFLLVTCYLSPITCYFSGSILARAHAQVSVSCKVTAMRRNCIPGVVSLNSIAAVLAAQLGATSQTLSQIFI